MKKKPFDKCISDIDKTYEILNEFLMYQKHINLGLKSIQNNRLIRLDRFKKEVKKRK